MAKRRTFLKRSRTLSIQRRIRRMHHIKYHKSLVAARHAMHFMMQQR